MQEQAENNYSFFDKRDLARHLSDDVKASLIRHLIPLRHVEHRLHLDAAGDALVAALLVLPSVHASAWL